MSLLALSLGLSTAECETSADENRLDTFFEHHKMFIDLSIPRFKSRLTLHDRRRPSLALLNAMVGEHIHFPVPHLSFRGIAKETEKHKLTNSTCGQPECPTHPICRLWKRISTNRQSSITTLVPQRGIDSWTVSVLPFCLVRSSI